VHQRDEALLERLAQRGDDSKKLSELHGSEVKALEAKHAAEIEYVLGAGRGIAFAAAFALSRTAAPLVCLTPIAPCPCVGKQRRHRKAEQSAEADRAGQKAHGGSGG
jgi:hypothetical protein